MLLPRAVHLLALLTAVVAVTPVIRAQALSTKIHGYVIADAYGVASHHDPAVEEQTGFWIRRGYLTVDHVVAPRWTSRLRFEVNSPGDFTTSSRLEPFVKDLYLQWSTKTNELYFGISPSPIYAAVESFWGLRHVEKVAADLYRFGSSRDFGVIWKGHTVGRSLAAHASIGNGAGERSETNRGKKAALALNFIPAPGILLEVYGDVESRSNQVDQTTGHLFAGWKSAEGRVGLQYAVQHLEFADDSASTLAVVSLFGVVKLAGDYTAFARVDHLLDPHPEANKIPYLDLYPNRKFDLFIAGVERPINPQITVAPNVELVSYRDRPGQDDIPVTAIGKLTLYYRF